MEQNRCECCETNKNVLYRVNPLYPIFPNSLYICDDCVKKDIVPLFQLFSILELYKTEDINCIPKRVLKICINTILNNKDSIISSIYNKKGE